MAVVNLLLFNYVLPVFDRTLSQNFCHAQSSFNLISSIVSLTPSYPVFPAVSFFLPQRFIFPQIFAMKLSSYYCRYVRPSDTANNQIYQPYRGDLLFYTEPLCFQRNDERRMSFVRVSDPVSKEASLSVATLSQKSPRFLKLSSNNHDKPYI